MSGPLVLQDHTRYSSDDISNEDLELLQAIQEELEREDCVFLASSPREEDGETPPVIRALNKTTIQTGSYVGSLVFRGRNITIHSRFDGENHLFLRYLLENAWEVSSLVAPVPEGPAGPEDSDFYQ